MNLNGFFKRLAVNAVVPVFIYVKLLLIHFFDMCQK